ncbi:MAG TPA: metallophosphoesterase, partial [Myxococcota bacterium]|nr:metallophosphoesterase [Myxococcota bacterium]
FLSEDDAQPKFTQARFEAIRALGRVAREESCEAVVVCGDVFESNQVDRRTVVRALDALAEVPAPVFLLPGNHDPLDAGSVYRSRAFLDHRPAHVSVLEGGEPLTLRPGLELVGAPWMSKRPLRDLIGGLLRELPPCPPGLVRVCVGHGGIAELSGSRDDPSQIDIAGVERAIVEGRIHYLALGDRHSTTSVGTSGRIWYAGAPESTDYDEVDPGNVLVVELGPDGARVVPRHVGRWRFTARERVDLASAEDVAALEEWLDMLDAKDRTIVKLRLAGQLSLRLRARLDEALRHARELVAAVEVRDAALVTVPDDHDFSEIELAGFARAGVEALRAQAQAGGDAGATARDALALLVRLAEAKP